MSSSARRLLLAFGMVLACGESWAAGASGTVREVVAVEAAGRVFELRHSRGDAGNVVVIANRSSQVLRLVSAGGLDAVLESLETTSWSCGAGRYADNLVVETATGYHLASPALSCGEVLYIDDGGASDE
ncbi:hypothetical protein [Parahaliea mediterranea]|uniref:Cellulase n=1 Tax=Parahaliea mediterranea TaxID=651086 RepID=A0A939DIU0_9GAMM|nr:hypothetical protein [Parahaliea mediterranea]MBN7798778.1 hypothetical protein [Parahaliea mediterranea]